MSAQFVATALSFCIWNGKIRLLGRKRRPWLTLQRCELEQTYLRHQLRQLRRVYPGELEHEFQAIGTDGFYDDCRLLVHCPEMQRVYDLLYPRDEKCVSPQVLAIAGPAALASLWSDRGRSDGKTISFASLRSKQSTLVAAEWLDSLGYGSASELIQPSETSIRLSEDATKRFAKDVYPLVHVTMRKGLRSGRR